VKAVFGVALGVGATKRRPQARKSGAKGAKSAVVAHGFAQIQWHQLAISEIGTNIRQSDKPQPHIISSE